MVFLVVSKWRLFWTMINMRTTRNLHAKYYIIWTPKPLGQVVHISWLHLQLSDKMVAILDLVTKYLTYGFHVVLMLIFDFINLHLNTKTIILGKLVNISWLLDRSLMIGWRKNSWNPERVSSVFTFVSVCVSVCVYADYRAHLLTHGPYFWVKWSLGKNLFSRFSKFSFLPFLFAFFPYTECFFFTCKT